LATEAAAKPELCHVKDKTHAPNVAVTLAEGQKLTAGASLQVHWKVQGGVDLGCKTPLYLVFSFPNRVRFEGEGIIALPANAPAPYDIAYMKDRTRMAQAPPPVEISFIDDLVLEPVNHLRTGRRAKCLAAQGSLAARIVEYQPEAIVVLLKGIQETVFSAATAAGSKADLYAVPQPNDSEPPT
jgi:hypothetical protein